MKKDALSKMISGFESLTLEDRTLILSALTAAVEVLTPPSETRDEAKSSGH